MALPLASAAWLEKKQGSKEAAVQAKVEIPPAVTRLNRFLDDCTRCLKLPRAVKIAYTTLGLPLSDVAELKQDDVVYVSFGESFIHASGTKVELIK